ncbi:MAG: hypothetical protein HQL50_15670 [Magnetococcales bacterium]|nr:hypothetical protein [Magnetococcales bacterium]
MVTPPPSPRIATPVSHLFENETDGDTIAALSDCLECRDRSLENSRPDQTLFHCNLQPIHAWGDAEWHTMRRIRKLKPDLQLLSLHAASVCDDPLLEGAMFQPGGRSYSRDELLETAGRNFSALRRIMG